MPTPSISTFVRLALAVTLVSAPPAAQSARVVLGPAGGTLKASGAVPGAFLVENTSAAARIVEVRIDLEGALFPDLVFDPSGGAGDLLAKALTADGGAAAGAMVAHAFEDPHDGGFDALRITFDGFDPGETFAFSIDVDPTSIQGAASPGPSESGSVSGLELAGATVRVTFDQGPPITSRAFRAPGSLSASECVLQAGLPAAPGLSIQGYATPAQAFVPSVTARVTGAPGRTVRLAVVEGALFLFGVPGGGHDVDPFEANSAVLCSELSAVLDASGQALIQVPLQKSASNGGLHSLIAVQETAAGVRGPASEPVRLEYVDTAINFNKFKLQSLAALLPTTLAWGPDGRLYIGEQSGTIRALSIARVADGFKVTAQEAILKVRELENHDDDGTPAPTVLGRQVTGILVAGTASSPVIYVASSDPRIGGELIGETGLDTNSGVLSRLSKAGGAWTRKDLVRGLPRSEENHGPNGLWLDEQSQILYLAQGGNTNMGAPSAFFANLPEYALSGAILAIDLAAIGETTYDLPTLDDEDRPGNPDANDPFGGNDGKNQARLVPGGPVQVHSPGWRNPYDLVVTQEGRMYAVDNGPNGGWGDTPALAGGACTNDVVEPGVFDPDSLHHVTGPGYYAGHPNPTRASTSNTFNPTNPQSPVSVSNPLECAYLKPGPEDGSLVTWPASTNGIAEYTATAFDGALRGDLLAIGLDQKLQRVKLDAEGDDVILSETLFSSVGNGPLDVVTRGDLDPFPGTIWVVNRLGNGITVFEPAPAIECTGEDSFALDDDGDGYSNADEIDNGTDPCSSGDVPVDHDQDFLSDLNDPDDDEDNLPDQIDSFALDASNGTTSAAPFALEWETDVATGAGILGLGFTGVMSNGVAGYAELFDPEEVTAGGAAGVFTLEQPGPGTAFGPANTLEAGFQIGFRTPATPFTVRTRVVSPFLGLQPSPVQQIGFTLGTGTQSDFCAVLLTGKGPRFEKEVDDASSTAVQKTLDLPGPAWVDLWLAVDPIAATATPWYQAADGSPKQIAGPQSLPVDWFQGSKALAAGLFATRGSKPAFAATWSELAVEGAAPAVRVNAGPPIGGWPSDAAFVVGPSSTYTSPTPVVVTPYVPTFTPLDVFRTERKSAGAPLAWSFPLPSGVTYDVQLYFAEIVHDAAGAREFDVYLEDELVLDDYDVAAEVGPDVGTVEAFEVALADGALDVRLVPKVGDAKLSGIEVMVSPGPVPGKVELYGAGLGGANLGALDALPPPVIGAPFGLVLGAMGPSPLAAALLSLDDLSLPFLGGTLLVSVPWIGDPIVLPLIGGAGVHVVTLPALPAFVGLSLFGQGAAPDPTLPGGWRFTNGVKLTIGG